MKKRRTIFRKDKQLVLGRFYFDGYGRAIERKLCTFEEYFFKTTKAGKRKPRTNKEQEILFNQLYDKKEQELLKEFERNPRIKKNSKDIKDIMQSWIDHVSIHRAKGTVIRYSRAVNYYIEAIGNHPIEDYKKHFQDTFTVYLKKRNLSLATIHKIIGEVNSFFYWCFDNEYIDKQIKMKKPLVTIKEPSVYTLFQKKYLECLITGKYLTGKQHKQCYKNHLRMFYMVKETGMRNGEIWSLKLANIKDNVIEVKDNQELNWRIKGKAERVVPISERLHSFLTEDLQERNRQEKYYLDDGLGNIAYAEPSNVTKAFNRYLKDIGIHKKIKPLHGFRASVATELLDKDVEITKVQSLLGHRSITTTKKYQNTQKQNLQEIVNLLS